MTFDPLLNISISLKGFCRFQTLKYLSSLHENNWGGGGGGGTLFGHNLVECFEEGTCDLVGSIFETCWK